MNAGEEFLLGFIFSKPELYGLVRENLIDNIPIDMKTEKFYMAFKRVYNRLSAIDLEAVKAELEDDDRGKTEIYSLLIETDYPDFSDEATEREVMNLVRTVNRQNLYNVQKDYEYQIRGAADPGEKIRLLNQYNQVLKLSSKLN